MATKYKSDVTRAVHRAAVDPQCPFQSSTVHAQFREIIGLYSFRFSCFAVAMQTQQETPHAPTIELHPTEFRRRV